MGGESDWSFTLTFASAGICLNPTGHFSPKKVCIDLSVNLVKKGLCENDFVISEKTDTRLQIILMGIVMQSQTDFFIYHNFTQILVEKTTKRDLLYDEFIFSFIVCRQPRNDNEITQILE